MDSPEARGGGGSLGVTRKLQGGRNLAEGKGDGGPRPRQRLRRHELEQETAGGESCQGNEGGERGGERDSERR
eukprot:294623-Prymnesium_polylepis.1